MEKSIVEQERELKDAIRRAKATPDRTGTLRRETLKRLIELTHSVHPSLKIQAAEGIRFFFSDFPDLEEEAINAVYDLCEDQSQKVRIEGYKAITLVSRAQVKWVKRNADVLVQLLQSDEPDEVTVVKHALVEHLDLDPRITMAVLCDQIVPSDELMDDDEAVLRDRLRSLVLAFLTGMAKHSVIRHATPGSEAEVVLHSGLIKALPKFSGEEIEKVVRDLLLALPGYRNPTFPGQAFLDILLGKATECMHNELLKGKTVALASTRFYLNLANLLVNKRASPPVDLMRFYLTSFGSKMTLQRLAREDQAMILYGISDTLEACETCDMKSVDAMQLGAVRRQAVDACPIFFELLAESSSAELQARNAVVKLLRACVQRKRSSDWIVSQQLSTVLNRVSASPLCRGNDGQVRQIQDLIRSLEPAPQEGSKSRTPQLQSTSFAKLPSPRMRLPDKPLGANQTLSPPRLGKRQAIDDVTSRQYPGVNAAELAVESDRMQVDINLQDNRRPKRVKRGGGGHGDNDSGIPSLLHRLSQSATNEAGHHRPTRVPREHVNTGRLLTSQDFDMDSSDAANAGTGKRELSIKGAASRAEGPGLQARLSDPSKDTTNSLSGTSLLHRLDGAPGGRKAHRQKGKA